MVLLSLLQQIYDDTGLDPIEPVEHDVLETNEHECNKGGGCRLKIPNLLNPCLSNRPKTHYSSARVDIYFRALEVDNVSLNEEYAEHLLSDIDDQC